MQHHLVERDEPRDLARQVHPAGPRHPLPCRVGAPRVPQRRDLGRQGLAPALLERRPPVRVGGGVGQRSQLLVGRRPERQRQPHEVLDQLAHAPPLARGAELQLSVRDAGDRLLLFPEDKPKLKKKSIDQIDYIPDYVLEQLFMHIDDLHKEVVPVVWVAYKTGLRISDVLGLTSNCLERINGKYSIVTDIEKTYVQGHRIPIDEELANILAILIHKSKENSNQGNNPEGFIFVRYRGSRKGNPYFQKWIQRELNKLAKQKNIVDENGKLFHFKLHQFRHTYAVKMLNSGADILTVQELLAHASPEMTLRYAKLLDDTKRKAFESVFSKGLCFD